MEKRRGLTWLILRRFRKNRLAIAGLGTILIFFILAIFAPFIAPHDPLKMDLSHALEPPSLIYPLGRDELGRCILSRIIYGAQISLLVGLITVAIGVGVGAFIGVISGYYGGKVDLIIQRITDIMLAFPSILLAIAIIAILGIGLYRAMIAIGISFIPVYVRLVRGKTLSIKEMGFVEAARALGIRDYVILFKHILINCLDVIIVQATLNMGTSILWAAALSFIGLGAQAPTPEWGAMLSGSRPYLRAAPHATTFPGLAIFITVIAFNLVGDGLRDALRGTR